MGSSFSRCNATCIYTYILDTHMLLSSTEVPTYIVCLFRVCRTTEIEKAAKVVPKIHTTNVWTFLVWVCEKKCSVGGVTRASLAVTIVSNGARRATKITVCNLPILFHPKKTKKSSSLGQRAYIRLSSEVREHAGVLQRHIRTFQVGRPSSPHWKRPICHQRRPSINSGQWALAGGRWTPDNPSNNGRPHASTHTQHKTFLTCMLKDGGDPRLN